MLKSNKRDRSLAQETADAPSAALPWQLIQKHPRFLSDFKSNTISINVAHHLCADQKIWSCNLEERRFARLNHVSPDGNMHYALKDFPELMTPLKAAINSMLFSRTEMVDDCVSGLINHAQKLFSWMVDRSIFKLSQLSQADIKELRDGWRHGGWWHVLNYDKALADVLEIAKINQDVAGQLSGFSNSQYLTVDATAITKMTGLPISGNFIPVKFAEILADIDKAKRVAPERTARSTKVTATVYQRLMVETNRFASLPKELGAIPFVPFPDANKIAEKAFPAQRGRTKNISIDNALKVVDQALRWVSEYKDIVINTAQSARTALEHAIEKGGENPYAIQKAIAEAYSRQTLSTGISIPGTAKMTRAKLIKCVETLLVACFCLVAINHGRRRNEIVGHNKPYGLYFGCVKEISTIYEDWRIDIYIEKSSRAYLSFWCNDIVRTAVTCLEEISQIFRPLFSDRKTYPSNRTNNRSDKLFALRTFTAKGFEGAPIEFDFTRTASWFFDLAGVDASYFREKTQPFRRIFACIHKYRYDMPKTAPLTQHFDHDVSSITEVYYTDSPGTLPSEGVKAIYGTGYGKDLASFKKLMDEVTSEYFVDVMHRLLKGELIGGNFAKLALKLMRRISGSIKFQQLTQAEKAEQIGASLMRRNYTMSEKEHAICCVTEDAPTLRRSNCFDGGEIHPENATPQVCGSCIHMLTTEGYRRGLVNSLDELAREATSFSLPPGVRHQIKKDQADLAAFIVADEKVAHENQIAMSALTASWNKVFVIKAI
jgi:hypothetical protein